MAFTHLFLKDFQAHKSLRIPLDKRVTTIVGATDTGKSSIMRALKWVCLNEPNGSKFIRHGKGMATVELGVGSGTVIRRRKDKGRVNAYSVLTVPLNGWGEPSEHTLKAFGNSVPDEVAGVVRVKDSNFQGQHDPSFWFSSTAGEVSKNINAVVNLQLIDTVMNGAASRVRAARERISLLREDLKESTSSVDDLKYAPKMAAELDEAEEAIERWRVLFERQSSIRKMVERIEAVIRHAKAKVPDTSELDDMYESLCKRRSKISKLRNLIERIADAEESVADLTTKAVRCEREFHKSIKGETCPLCNHRM